jgi:predicted ATP-grasp superfamily ATP-dependent carboligase
MKVLVAGFNVRHIACSASRAGHQVFAADCYCDLDLERCAIGFAMLSRERPLADLSACMERLRPQALILGPGLEEAEAEGGQLKGIRVLNNPRELVSQVSDKLWLARWLEEEGYPFIRTSDSPEGASFPAVVKPRKGAGGMNCRLAKDATELGWSEGMIVQDFVAGRPASVSVIGDGQRARAVVANEQLIGEAWTGAEAFRYCGNITPLEPATQGLEEMAEEIVSQLGLVGSNGVDFLLTAGGPVVVEVNPRFQGSLDTVEMTTGLNVFQAHVDAFRGLLPDRPVAKSSAGRAIIYAQKDLVATEMAIDEWTADVTRPGNRIKQGEPVLSLLAQGTNRKNVLTLLERRATMLARQLEQDGIGYRYEGRNVPGGLGS